MIDHDAEWLAEHIKQGEGYAQQSALMIVNQIAEGNEDTWSHHSDVAMDFDGSYVVAKDDQEMLAMFTNYGVLRMELSMLRLQLKSLDSGKGKLSTKDLLSSLMDEIKTIV